MNRYQPCWHCPFSLLIWLMVTIGALDAADQPGRLGDMAGSLQGISPEANLPYPKSRDITGMSIDWATHQRFAQGSDNWQLTWAADGNLYGAWGDGGGFEGTNSLGRVPLGVGKIMGNPDSIHGYNVWGGYQAQYPATFKGKSWGMIGLGTDLYMWVMPDVPAGMSYRNHYEYAELAMSKDYSATWSILDFRFFSDEDLTAPTFLNYGKAGTGAPQRFGKYIYSYFIKPMDPDMEQQGPNGVGLIVHKPGVLYLARTPRDRFPPARQDFQFFAGLDHSGNPTWGSLEDKVPVFEDPNGTGWCLSACYHPGLDRVLLATEHSVSHAGQLGVFEALNPWGPWNTVAYYTEDNPFGHERPGDDLDWANNVFYLSFPTKWFNGNEFSISFTGGGRGKDNDSFNLVSGRFLTLSETENIGHVSPSPRKSRRTEQVISKAITFN